MVLVTSPKYRQAQKKKQTVVLIVVSVVTIISIISLLVWISSSTTTTTTDAAAAGGSTTAGAGSSHNLQSLRQRLPIQLLRQRQQKQQKQKQHDETKEWPPLSAVYDGRRVIADPQFLLDFAVIGFEKSGTSTLMKWLGEHPEIQCFQEEIYDLYRNKTGSMVWRLHTQMKSGYDTKRGYKSPIDIFNANALHLLDLYFPKTKLLLALRHPVLYYESLYNFRIQNLPEPDTPFITPMDGLGDCTEPSQGVCTDHSNFAAWMYRMGKTIGAFPTDVEKQLLKDKSTTFTEKAQVRTRNPVFVVELTQLIDTDHERKQQLKNDLQLYLGLTQPLSENPIAVPGKKWSSEIQAIKDQRKMNICDTVYDELRSELMRLSRLSCQWILESFVQSNDVFVSNPEYFEQVMLKWMDDPCDERRRTRKQPYYHHHHQEEEEEDGDKQEEKGEKKPVTATIQ